MKINVLIIICNIIFYIFIDQQTSYFFLTKNVGMILQPFSIKWGGKLNKVLAMLHLGEIVLQVVMSSTSYRSRSLL